MATIFGFTLTRKKKQAQNDQTENVQDGLIGDVGYAIFALTYLLLALIILGWFLFDIWIGQHTLPRLLGYGVARLNTPGYRLMAYTIIGGGIGAIVNGVRSCLLNYKWFSRYFIWKYVMAPWMGATLGLFVYSLLHSSIVVFGGGSLADNVGTTQALANFAAGALAGYGSKDVYIWLDSQVQNLFKITQPVPDTIGKSTAAAASRLHAANLEVGQVTAVPTDAKLPAGTVLAQDPSPKETVDKGATVDITVAKNPDSIVEQS